MIPGASIPDRDQPERRSGGGGGENEAVPLLSPLRELQLVEAYKQGDPDAIGTLLRSYQRRIYAVCYRMLRNEDEARDLTQDAMIKVLEGLESFDARARLSTWVIRVTMNCCLSYLRKRKLRRHMSLDVSIADEEGAGAASGGATTHRDQLPDERELPAADRVEREERRSTLLRGLESLDPHMRAVLVLRDMQDLDYQQIAEVIDKPVGTVKSRLFRARAALREAIEAMESPGEDRREDDTDDRP